MIIIIACIVIAYCCHTGATLIPGQEHNGEESNPALHVCSPTIANSVIGNECYNYCMYMHVWWMVSRGKKIVYRIENNLSR